MKINRHQRRALKAANRRGYAQALAPAIRYCLVDGCTAIGESAWVTPAGIKGALCAEHGRMLDEAQAVIAYEREREHAAERLARLPAWRLWLLALWARLLNLFGVGPWARLGPPPSRVESARPLSSEAR